MVERALYKGLIKVQFLNGIPNACVVQLADTNDLKSLKVWVRLPPQAPLNQVYQNQRFKEIIMGRSNSNVYPKVKDTVRPFRIWNANDKKQLSHRYFAFHDNAINAALKDAKWVKGSKVALEVFNTTNGVHIATINCFKRGANSTIDVWVNGDWNYKRG